jgi:hypothetical protein
VRTVMNVYLYRANRVLEKQKVSKHNLAFILKCRIKSI